MEPGLYHGWSAPTGPPTSPISPGGRSLECADGTVFTGCNVENAAYGSSICAERTALVKAVSEGHRDDFTRIAVVGNSTEPCWPCGACRQMLYEFAPGLTVLVAVAAVGAYTLAASIASWNDRPSTAATATVRPAPMPSASSEPAMSGGYEIGPDGVLVRPAEFGADTYTKPELPEEANENRLFRVECG